MMTSAPKKLVPSPFSREVGIALRKAARQARVTARRFGTPIYVLQGGRIVALKP